MNTIKIDNKDGYRYTLVVDMDNYADALSYVDALIDLANRDREYADESKLVHVSRKQIISEVKL